MKQDEKIRKQVSKSYAIAVTKERGCCGSAPKGVAAKLAGYAKEELEGLPDEAWVNSFGCGNPLAFAGVKEGDVVLDLGSGAGIDLLLAARKVGARGRVIGVDMTDEMIAKARENVAASGFTNIEVRKGIIEELPVESNSVDWVISNCVINLSPDKPRVFAEIVRVLKPGGQMIVSDIVAKDLPKWALESAELYSSCIAGAISEEEYIGGLKSAGLVAVEARERLIYEPAQIAAIVESDLPEELKALTGCCGGKPLFASLFNELSGKVASVKFYARKPGAI
ncbi:MAG: hypothetical protein Kow0090_11740 [Myxococcota bacterium]